MSEQVKMDPNITLFQENKDLLQKTIEIDSKDQSLENLYAWVDQVPLTRPKKNIMRDFSDCSLLA